MPAPQGSPLGLGVYEVDPRATKVRADRISASKNSKLRKKREKKAPPPKSLQVLGKWKKELDKTLVGEYSITGDRLFDELGASAE